MNIIYSKCQMCGTELYPWWVLCEDCEETAREIYGPLEDK